MPSACGWDRGATRLTRTRWAAPSMQGIVCRLVCALLPVLPGCSHLIHGKSQGVTFTSVPDHQVFTVDGTAYRTPATVELERKSDHEVCGPAGERLVLHSEHPAGYVLMDLPVYVFWVVTMPLYPWQAADPYIGNTAFDRDAVHFGEGEGSR